MRKLNLIRTVIVAIIMSMTFSLIAQNTTTLGGEAMRSKKVIVDKVVNFKTHTSLFKVKNE